MRKVEILFLLCLISAISSVAMAQPPPIGCMAGTVVDSVFHVGISGVVVTASDGYSSYSDTTDSQGRYLMVDMQTVPYTVIAARRYFWPDTAFDMMVYADDTTIVNFVLAPTFIIGDMNCNGIVNGIDIVYFVNWLKGLGPPPCDPLIRGDANGNCAINGVDVIYILNYFGRGGPAPRIGDCP